MRGRCCPNLWPSPNRQMASERGSDLRQSTVRNLVSFGDRFERTNELRLIEAGIVKNRFDDRRLLPSCKQNVDLATDRSCHQPRSMKVKRLLQGPRAAGICEESDCANDCRKPSTLLRRSVPDANQLTRHHPRQDGIAAALNQPRLITGRRGRFCRALDHRPHLSSRNSVVRLHKSQQTGPQKHPIMQRYCEISRLARRVADQIS
jgi:hypothetical protein